LSALYCTRHSNHRLSAVHVAVRMDSSVNCFLLRVSRPPLLLAVDARIPPSLSPRHRTSNLLILGCYFQGNIIFFFLPLPAIPASVPHPLSDYQAMPLSPPSYLKTTVLENLLSLTPHTPQAFFFSSSCARFSMFQRSALDRSRYHLVLHLFSLFSLLASVARRGFV